MIDYRPRAKKPKGRPRKPIRPGRPRGPDSVLPSEEAVKRAYDELKAVSPRSYLWDLS